MKKRFLFITVATATMALASSCTVNKKKKCDTCPKWTSEIVSTQPIQRT